MTNNIFISYSHSDKTKQSAQKIAKALDGMGLKVWLDQEKIKVGDSLNESIEKGLDEAGYVVALVSPHDKENPWYQAELRKALAKGKPIFPVIIDNATPEDMPEPIKDRLAINISDNYKALEQIYEAIDSNRDFWSKVKEYLINR